MCTEKLITMENTSKRIFLVPTDFSEVCNNAMKQAAIAASEMGAKVYLLHIINTDTRNYLRKENLATSSLDDKLNAMVEDLKKEYGIEAAYKIKEGSIFTDIAEIAEELNAALIFLGTHGKTGMQHLTGSFAIKVITSAHMPTIVVQERPFNHAPKHIVLPVTSEAGPMEKTRHAAMIANAFNATIHIYQIGASEEQVSKAVSIMSEFFDKNNVAYDIKVATAGNFSKQVIDFAVAKNADMILIMTNPDKNLTKFILGSYDEDMIFNVPQIPVMCVNPRKKEWEKLRLL